MDKKRTKEQKSSNLKIENYSHINDTIKVIYGAKDAVAKGVEFMEKVKKKMDLCFDSKAPSIVLNIDEYKNGYINIRQRGGKIRVITEINKENIEYCKKLMNIVDEMRHLDNIKGGTAISETEYMTTNILHESKPLTQVVYSNVIDVVEQQQNFFDSLWKNAIPARQKIREVTNQIKEKHIDIFSVLSNKIRRSMIFYLVEGDMTISKLAKKLNMTLQAMQKHLPQLVEINIIDKKPNGNISLTEIGHTVAKQIPSFQFLFENREYLRNHVLSLIPPQFLQRIGDLQEFEIVSGIESTERCKTFFDEIEEYIKLMTLQTPLNVDFIEFSKLLKKNVKISHIIDKNTVLPPNWSESTKKLEKSRFGKERGFEKKIVENVPIMLCVSEKSAYLALQNLDGTVDVSSIMFSNNKKFISWCVDLFNHIWKNR